ncbi:hypothetical protein D3C80_1722040 [compost metagenome]
MLPPSLLLLIVDHVLTAAFAYPLRLMGGYAFRVALKAQIKLGGVRGSAFQPLLRQTGGQPLRFAAQAVQQAVTVHQTVR